MSRQTSRLVRDNIEPVEERTAPAEVIDSLRPVVFEFKNTPGKKVYGFIAEDVEQVNQDLVTYKNGQLEGVDYLQIIPLMVTEIKSLRAELSRLRSSINENTYN